MAAVEDGPPVQRAPALSETARPAARLSRGGALPSVDPRQVHEWVKEGRAVFVYSRKVYDLTRWIKHHPGGQLAVRNMVGRDCTDEVKSNHPEWVIARKMPNFCVAELTVPEVSAPTGPVLEKGRHPAETAPAAPDDAQSAWPLTAPPSPKPGPVPTTPPYREIPGSEALFKCEEQQKISDAWRRLEAQLKQDGLFETDYRFYWAIAAVLVVCFATACALIILGPPNSLLHFLSALLLAVVWQQGAFVAHDAGHNGITQKRKIDTKIGLFLGNLLGGISFGWWKKSHNVHHIVTNHPEHDPDIQHLPFFAVTTRFFQSLYSTYHKKILKFDTLSKILVPWQHYLFYPIMSLARPNLYAQSLLFLAFDEDVLHRKTEIALLALFFAWYAALLSFLPTWGSVAAFVAVSHIFSGILHLQISLSHFGMSTEDFGPGEAFASRQLRTTMDVDCPEWLDWFHGGLQFQAVHHLFPRLPRHNLRRAQAYVRRFCEANGLEYHLHSFAKGNRVVLSSMREVAHHIDFIISTGLPPFQKAE